MLRKAACRCSRDFSNPANSRRVFLPVEPLEPRTLLAFTPIGPEFRANTYTTGYQGDSAIATDADGDFVIAWAGSGASGFGIHVQRFNAAGVPQGTELHVSTISTYAAAPALAMDADGDFVVAWHGSRNGADWDIYAQRYSAAGIRQGAEFRANTSTAGQQRYPTAAMDADGDFVIGWQGTGPTDSYGIYAQRYNAAGVRQGDEFRVNTYSTGTQDSPAVAMNADGDFIFVWHGEGPNAHVTINAQRYCATGAPQGTEFCVNPQGLSWMAAPSIAIGTDGSFVIAWHGAVGVDCDDVYAQRFGVLAEPQGDMFRVNTYTRGDQMSPVLGMDAAGNFTIAWSSTGQDGNDVGIVAQRYSAAGEPQGVEFCVNTYTDDAQSFPSLAENADGELIIAWTSINQDGSDGGVYAQRYVQVSDPAAVSGRVWNDADADGLQDADENGIAAVTVRLYSDVAFPLFTTTTNSDGTYQFDVVPPAKFYHLEFLPPSGMYFPAQHQGVDDTLDSDPDPITGRTASFDLQAGQTRSGDDAGLVPPSSITGRVYIDVNGNGVRDPGERPLQGATLYLDVNNDGKPNPAEPSLRTLVDGWYSMGGLRFGTHRLRINVPEFYRPTTPEDGLLTMTLGIGQNCTFDFGAQSIVLPTSVVLAGDEFRANTRTQYDQTASDVAMDADGDFVIAWQSYGRDGSGWGICAQRYNAAGQRQGGEFQVNTWFANAQCNPALAMDASGNFIIVWTGVGQDDSSGIFARRYDAAGHPQGAEFRVNTFTVGDQTSPAVAMDASGDVVIAWESVGQDGAGKGIYAQRYDAAGLPLGSEFRVNASTSNDQSHPSIGMDAAGCFAIAWAGSKETGGTSIYFQRYTAAGEPQGSESHVNAASDNQSDPDLAMDADGDFVLAWEGYALDGTSGHIGAQRYNSAGEQQGIELRANTPWHQALSVAMDADGDFVISWHNIRVIPFEGPNLDVHAQRYYANGTPHGAVFVVNTYSNDRQVYPAVAMDADGDFVIVWQSKGGDGNGYGIYAQRYTANHSVQGTTLSDTFRLSGAGSDVAIAVDGVAPTPLYTHLPDLALPFCGLAGDDRLIIDFTTGNPIPAAGLTFTGGDGDDALLFTTTTNYDAFTNASSTLDLVDNTLLIQNATLPLVESWLKSNRLFSSLKTQHTTLAPFPQPDGSILVKLTYYGDTNHDGQVNLTDYFTIDSAYLNKRSGFASGDVNLDGEINLNDYFLIDSAYLAQNDPLTATMVSSLAVDPSSGQNRRIPPAKDKTGGRRKVFSTQRVKAGHRGRRQRRPA